MKIRFAGLLVGAVLCFAMNASADENAPSAGKAPKGDRPCAKVVAACKAAGFVAGQAKEKKGLWKDCVEPIKAGQTVEGVTVDPNDVQACQARGKKPAGH